VIKDISELARICKKIIDEIEIAVIGKRDELELILTAVLAGGHVLIEDYPGLGKTLIARCFAATLGLVFKRIQFTPDLLPGDITGGYIYNRSENRFELRKGPIFANIILADEINRASPKTQSALLEAMQEKQVTIEGETLVLIEPFLVLATQNPIEYEGTFPLPEAQLDRFMVKISIGYPTKSDETLILSNRRKREKDEFTLNQITNTDELMAMRKMVESVHVDKDLETYIVDIIHQTREDNRVAVGASPRGSLAFLKMARAFAAIHGRDFVLPDDIKRFDVPVLSHRLIMEPAHWMAPRVARDVIRDVFNKIPVPVLDES
jgi:MoxR-like ATPase